MNNIPTIQNSQRQLERLAAQRELYSSAKKFHVVQIFLTVVIPVALAILALNYESFSVPAAIFGVASFIADILIIEPIINKRKEKAAKIQELFDCDVLELPKSPLKTVQEIKVEEVLQNYDAHSKIATNIEKIKDWYRPVTLGSLPIHVARVICQRTNCWWDSKLRKNYATTLRIICGLVFITIFIIGSINRISLPTFTLIISSLVPFFQFCIKQSNDNVDAACRLDQLVNFSIALWDKVLNGMSEPNASDDSRKLQDEIFEHRKKSPLILDMYYGLFRNKDEAIMNKAGGILVEEAIATGNF